MQKKLSLDHLAVCYPHIKKKSDGDIVNCSVHLSFYLLNKWVEFNQTCCMRGKGESNIIFHSAPCDQSGSRGYLTCDESGGILQWRAFDGTI